jgi:cytochrome c biogenesis protein CcmG, thiol:disulfide interchange protein DsbE
VFTRRWYVDAGLILIVVLLGILVIFRLEKVFKPTESQSEILEEAAVVENQPEEIKETGAVIVEDDPASVDDATGPVAALDFTLSNLSDEQVSLSDYLGTPVMVNFWATWCPPCKAEMPLIQEYQDKFTDEFVVLAINGGDSKELVQSFEEANGFTLNFLLDPDVSVATLYQVRGFPTSLFIDADGNLQATHIGELTATLFDAYLQKIGVAE